MLMLFAALVGLTTAALTGSLWTALAGQSPSLAMLFVRDAIIPLRVLVLVLHAPLLLVQAALRLIGTQKLLGLIALAAGGVWSFCEGVLILTQVFAFT